MDKIQYFIDECNHEPNEYHIPYVIIQHKCKFSNYNYKFILNIDNHILSYIASVNTDYVTIKFPKSWWCWKEN